jgi:DNA ligase (NAD+)
MKFEAIVPFSKLEEYNENTTGREYKNPRSMATGKLASDDFSEAVDYVRLVPLEMRKSWTEEKYAREVNWVHMGQMTSDYDHFVQLAPQVYRGKSTGVKEWLQKQYDTTIAERGGLDVMIDGLVIELMNPNLRESLGWTSGRSNYAFKLKLPYIEAETTCTGFRFDYGKTTGRITAVINFDTVVINNSDFNNVSLSNYGRWQELQPIGIGTKLLFQYRNDVMGYVEKLALPENDKVTPYAHITNCPKCKTELVTQEGTGKFEGIDTFIKCPSLECSGNVIGNGVVWCTKIGIKGVGESQIAALYDAGMFTSVVDLYNLDLKKVAALDGMGKSSAEKLNKVVHAKKVLLDWEVCGSLAIDGVGCSKFADLFQSISLMEILEEIQESDDAKSTIKLILDANPKGIKDKTATKIAEGLFERFNLMVDLLDILTINSSKVEVAEDFVSKKFCVTGSLNNWAKRGDLEKVLKGMGHTTSSGVSKNTSYLVTNDATTGSSKLQNAEKFGIPVISEDELIAMENLSVD